MLRDLYFYPLAAALIAGMVALALSFGGGEALSDAEIVEQGWTLEGEALRNLIVSPGTDMDYLDEDGGFVRMRANIAYGADGRPTPGIYAALGPDVERAFAGRTLRITVRARALPPDGLERFDSAYFPIEAAASPWAVFDLSPDWADYSYTFTPPIVAAPANTDLVSVYPGKRGENRPVDVARLRIEVVSEAEG